MMPECSAERGEDRLPWLFPIATTLHNLEEAVWLPAWSASTRGTRFHPPVGAPEFRFALAVLTILAFAVTALAVRRPERWLHPALGYAGAMFLNVFFPQ
jgi:hypothetical protein